MKLSHILEVYSKLNTHLRDYLHDKPLDFHSWGEDFKNWLTSTMDEDELEELLSDTNMSVEELHDYEYGDTNDSEMENIFNYLMRDNDKKNEFVEYIKDLDQAYAPPYSAMDLNHKKLLHRTTWLVHFCDDADGIKRKGFIYGHDDMEHALHLTRQHHDYGRGEGYNFAFVATSRDAINSRGGRHGGKYGDEFVLFQNAGVHVYHYGDEENQVIFWGSEVDKKHIIPVKYNRSEEEFYVQDQRTDKTLYKTDDYKTMVEWIIKNYNQYRKALTGF